MIHVLKEPLLHFLLLGAGLFLLYDQLNDAESSDNPQQIVISAGRIEQLAGIFQKTWQRPPSRTELQGLVDDFVLEEAYYRQAVEMGLDRDDTIVRRRMRQKLEFVTGDTVGLLEPSDEELQSYLTEHEEQFREPGQWTFRQVYFNPEQHGDDPQGWLQQQLTAFRAGETDAGDSSLLPENFDQAPQPAVDGVFGTGFTDQLKQLETGSWQGPVRSGLGYHLVLIESRVPGRIPELSAVRPAVLRDWTNDQRSSMRENMNASLLENYDVVIEWPDEALDTAATDEGNKR